MIAAKLTARFMGEAFAVECMLVRIDKPAVRNRGTKLFTQAPPSGSPQVTSALGSRFLWAFLNAVQPKRWEWSLPGMNAGLSSAVNDY